MNLHHRLERARRDARDCERHARALLAQAHRREEAHALVRALVLLEARASALEALLNPDRLPQEASR